MLQSHILVSGSGLGSLLVLTEPLSLWGGLDPQTGEIIDQRHPNWGEVVAGRVLMMPSGKGSSSASSILLEAVKSGAAPAVIILRAPDAIIALGAVVARELYGASPPVIVLSLEDYEYLAVQSPASVQVSENGEVHLMP